MVNIESKKISVSLFLIGFFGIIISYVLSDNSVARNVNENNDNSFNEVFIDTASVNESYTRFEGLDSAVVYSNYDQDDIGTTTSGEIENEQRIVLLGLSFKTRNVYVSLIILIALSIYLFLFKTDDEIRLLLSNNGEKLKRKAPIMKSRVSDFWSDVKGMRLSWKEDKLAIKIIIGMLLVVLLLALRIHFKNRVESLGVGQVSMAEVYYVIICNWLLYVAKLAAIVYAVYFVLKKIYLRIVKKKV